jgi:hypothetical protein
MLTGDALKHPESKAQQTLTGKLSARARAAASKTTPADLDDAYELNIVITAAVSIQHLEIDLFLLASVGLEVGDVKSSALTRRPHAFD